MGSSSHQLSPNGAWNGSVAKLNIDTQDECEEVRERIMGEGRGLSGENESRINESTLGLNDGREGAVTPSALHPGPQQQQQQHLPPGPVVRWEMILPVRTIKVLLVESDDSTRQVVSALLRNCSYEVTAAENGLQAWKILENPTNHVDLVLTEVVMPDFNGINLLSKIMSNDTCKNIPVIMMSSNDSMGTVFKCLSKGAVDFLVKPIRKNELKNLWQHVWRRSHSSSSSVSESGIQSQKSAKSKSVNDAHNNSSSNDEDDNASIGLNARDGSDNGSGTQSSWTKHAVEVDSPQAMSPLDQLADPHDSTCAQVISDSEIFCNKWVSMSMTAHREYHEQKKHADELMGKDLEIGIRRNPDAEPELFPAEKMSTKPLGKITNKQSENGQKNENILLGLESSSAFNDPSTKAADLIGGIANNTDVRLANGITELSTNDKNNGSSMELPSLQLSLKRLRSTSEVENGTHEDRNTLRRSDQSAFSRYRSSVASSQALTGCVGSCSPADNSSEAAKTNFIQNMVYKDSNPGTAKPGPNGSSDNNDKGSTTNLIVYTEKAAPTVALKGIHPSAFHPVHVQNSNHQVNQEKIDDMESTALVKSQYQVQHHHHHYHHHHHHHVQSMQQPLEHDDLSRKADAPQLSGSSNVCDGKTGGNAAKYSLNGSNSGSNHGSNAQNGSKMNIESANGVAERCDVSVGNGSGSGSGSSSMDQNRIAQREAALMKFRQKRKERNFGKKVRYHSRKRLAEQRPRVRGQFVRQPVQEPNKDGEGDS